MVGKLVGNSDGTNEVVGDEAGDKVGRAKSITSQVAFHVSVSDASSHDV